MHPKTKVRKRERERGRKEGREGGKRDTEGEGCIHARTAPRPPRVVPNTGLLSAAPARRRPDGGGGRLGPPGCKAPSSARN